MDLNSDLRRKDEPEPSNWAPCTVYSWFGFSFMQCSLPQAKLRFWLFYLCLLIICVCTYGGRNALETCMAKCTTLSTAAACCSVDVQKFSWVRSKLNEMKVSQLSHPLCKQCTGDCWAVRKFLPRFRFWLVEMKRCLRLHGLGMEFDPVERSMMYHN